MRSINRRECVTGLLALGASSPLCLARERSVFATQTEAPLSDARIIDLVRARIEARQSFGMAIGVIEGGRQRFVSAGCLGRNDARAVDENTVFGIASVTKPFIALLLADAVLRGELEYEADAETYLPDGVKLPARNGRRIAVLDLVTHTAGLPHELPTTIAEDARNRDAAAARAAMYEYLSTYSPSTDPGSAWSYSNLGYAVLGHILELRTRLAYADLLRERITGPLRMSSTAPTSIHTHRARRAQPHASSLDPAPEWNKPWMSPVLQSTARDLARFLSACLGDIKTPLAPAFAAMLQVRRPAPSIASEQALGWHVHPYDRGPLIGHTGGGGGFAATVMFDPTAKTAVVVLSNAEFMQDDLAQHVLRESLPLNPIRTELTLGRELLERYVGDYRDDTGAIASIRLDTNRLILLMPAGHKAPLTAESRTSFFVRGYEGLTVVFGLDATSTPQTLSWTLGGKTATARRISP